MSENEYFILRTLKTAAAPVKTSDLIQIMEISGKEFYRCAWKLFESGYIKRAKHHGGTRYDITDTGRAALK